MKKENFSQKIVEDFEKTILQAALQKKGIVFPPSLPVALLKEIHCILEKYTNTATVQKDSGVSNA